MTCQMLASCDAERKRRNSPIAKMITCEPGDICQGAKVGDTAHGADKRWGEIQNSRNDKVIIPCMEEEVGLEKELGRETTNPTLSALCRQLYLCTVPSGNRG